MKIIEAMNADRLIDKKIDRHLDFIRRYAARPDARDDSFEGKEKEKVQQNVQACLDLIAEREHLRRAITYTNLVSGVTVAGKVYSLHSLIQQRGKKTRGYADEGISGLKRKVWNALDDHAAQLELDKIRASMSKEASIKTKIIHNYDIEKKDQSLMEIDELEAAIDSAIQIANTKLDLLTPPTELVQIA